jgi:hypothetical protein
MSLRRIVAVSARLRPLAAGAALLCLSSESVRAAGPTVEAALAQVPTQKNVDYDRPTAAEAKTCTIAKERDGSINLLVVRGPSGEVLRAFADTNGDGTVDRFSYYKDGVEVYRDIDANHDKKVDQSRWLNSAGSRWGVDEDGNSAIDAWKVLSAEEASAEIVEAVKNRDAAAFARLLPTKDDLQAAGFEGDRRPQGLRRRGRRPETARRRRPLGEHAHPAAARRAAGRDARRDQGCDGLRQRRGDRRCQGRRQSGVRRVARTLRGLLAADRRAAAGRRDW